MKLRHILFSLLILLFSACGTTKGLNGSNTADKSLSAKSIIASHQAATPNFKTLAGRLQVVYEDENKLQSITVSLRMEKDKTIWIKASLLGITIAKALITQDRVSYYETISNSYFDGDFTLLSKWLGTEIDFDKAQAILLGQSIFPVNSSAYSLKIVENKYQLYPKQQAQNFIHYLFLDPKHYKVTSASLSQPNDKRLLAMRYGDYQELDGSFFPSEIIINAAENEKNTKIELNYKKIDLNVSVSFPFDIPSGYEEIQL